MPSLIPGHRLPLPGQKVKLRLAGKFHKLTMNADAALINTPLQWGVLPSARSSNRFRGFRRAVKTAEAVRAVLPLRVTPGSGVLMKLARRAAQSL